MGRTVRRTIAAGVVAAALAVAGVTVLAGSSAAAPEPGHYVALGDSYASGTGTAAYDLDERCERSSSAYPALLAASRPTEAFTFAACSGATTADVRRDQLSSLRATTSLVTISIGGNDVGFGDLIEECVVRDCNAELRAARASAAATLVPRLDGVYDEIRRRAPRAQVIVVGYPRLFSGAFCFGTTGVFASERTNANLLADEIDRVIAGRAREAGFDHVRPLTTFAGHAVCADAAWTNGLNVRDPGESFHPTRSGHRDGFLPLVRAALASS
jgi:lysophospholipase L1-like esterase